MKNASPPLVSLLHLRQMAMLAQRAVDCAVKTYELRDPAFTRQLERAEPRLCKLRHLVAERGRSLQASGVSLDADSTAGAAGLQIYSGLQTVYTAAKEITQNTISMLEGAGNDELALPRWREAARAVNSLVTAGVLAVLSEDLRVARIVLKRRGTREWRSIELSLRGGIGARRMLPRILKRRLHAA